MAIRVRNLFFGYAHRPVLDGIDLYIRKGCFTVVLGKNGSGKSTLFRILAGFLPPDRGEVSLLGRSVKDLSDRERARLLGFLPQHHRPVFPFLVEDVVLTGRASYIWLTPTREDRCQAERAMDLVGIGHLAKRTFTELSGGEQQLAMIARVLAQNPRIILFDEPTSHLDFYYQARVLEIIRDLVRQDYTVAAILHDPNLAALYGEHFICLKNGRSLSQAQEQRLDATVLESIYETPLEAVVARGKTLVLPARAFDNVKNGCVEKNI